MLRILTFTIILVSLFFGSVRAQQPGSSMGSFNSGSGSVLPPGSGSGSGDDTLDFRVAADGTLQVFNTSLGTVATACVTMTSNLAQILCRAMGANHKSYTYSNGGGTIVGNAWVYNFTCPIGAIFLGDCTYSKVPGCSQPGNPGPAHLACGKENTQFTFSVVENGVLLATRGSDKSTGTVFAGDFTDGSALAICMQMNTGVTQFPKLQWWQTVPATPVPPRPVLLQSVVCPPGGTLNFQQDCTFTSDTTAMNSDGVVAIDCGIDPKAPHLSVTFTIAGPEKILMATPAGSSVAVVAVALTKSIGLPTATAVCNMQGFNGGYPAMHAVENVKWTFFQSLSCPPNATLISHCTFVLGRAPAPITGPTPAPPPPDDPTPAPMTTNVAVADCNEERLGYSVSTTATGLVQVSLLGTGGASNGPVSTVCSKQFNGAGNMINSTTAQGLCKIITGNAVATSNIAYWNQQGASSLPIALTNVVCWPDAADVATGCPMYDTTVDGCTHDYDLALTCNKASFGPQFSFMVTFGTAQVRAPGTTSFLSVCVNWLTTPNEAGAAICKWAGLPTHQVIVSAQAADPSAITGIQLFSCPPGATSILDCKFSQSGPCGQTLQLQCLATTTPAPTTTTPAPPPKTAAPTWTPVPSTAPSMSPPNPTPPGPQPSPSPSPNPSPSPGPSSNAPPSSPPTQSTQNTNNNGGSPSPPTTTNGPATSSPSGGNNNNNNGGNSPNGTSGNGDGSSGGSPVGAIVGGVIGGVVLIGIIVYFLVFSKGKAAGAAAGGAGASGAGGGSGTQHAYFEQDNVLQYQEYEPAA